MGDFPKGTSKAILTQSGEVKIHSEGPLQIQFYPPRLDSNLG